MKKTSQFVINKILTRIYSHGRGWVFTPVDFIDLSNRSTISISLYRLQQKGTIRQLIRGLYDYPKIHPKLGILDSSADNIANALKGKKSARIQPSGAYAANLLGLTTQVPMKLIYLTDGRSKTVQLGNRQIILKHTTPRNMATAGRISGLIIQALRHYGKENINGKIIAQLDRQLDKATRKQLIEDIRYAPAWIADIFRRLASE